MDPARWRQVSAIFDAVFELPEAERAGYLDAACGGDDQLRREVQALLTAHDGPDHGLDRVATAITRELSSAPLAPGTRIGTFVIEDELGRGGMGVVYRAHDERLNRKVAVKALSPLPGAEGERARERLQREARAAAGLSHESIATVHALESRGDDLFIVSELVEGPTLRERLNRGALAIREALDVAIGVGRGLSAAHQRGVIHRDLKPENVIQTPTGVKILDFGIAQLESTAGASETPALDGLEPLEGDTRTSVSRAIIGTLGYMSPEQLRGGVVDARTDVFALGVLLYELLTGDPPFGRGDRLSIVRAVTDLEPPPIAVRVSGLPPTVAQIVATCLAKAPEARYQSTAAVVAALETARLALIGVAPASPVARALAPVSDARSTALWWWRFHLAAAAAAHTAMVVATWRFLTAIPGPAGRGLFLASLVLAAMTGILRLHLRFMARQAPAEAAAELARRAPWIRWGDRAFALVLAVGGVIVAGTHPELAAVCLASAAGTIAASEVIEPRTASRAVQPPGS